MTTLEEAHALAWQLSAEQLRNSQGKPAYSNMTEPSADRSNYNCKSDLQSSQSSCCVHNLAEGIPKKSHDPANFLVRGTSFQPSASTIKDPLAENYDLRHSVNIDPKHKPSQVQLSEKRETKTMDQFCEMADLKFKKPCLGISKRDILKCFYWIMNLYTIPSGHWSFIDYM